MISARRHMPGIPDSGGGLCFIIESYYRDHFLWRMVLTMRLALWQTRGHAADIAANLEALESTAKRSEEAGAALLLCPECWLGGYNIGAEVTRIAEPAAGPAAA